MKILVVEDEKGMAQVLRRGLEEESHVVSLAHDGVSALSLAQNAPFDLVLLDDVQGSYRMYKGLQLVVSGLNLSNEVFGFFTGSKIYPNQREYYHPSVIFGLRWTSTPE